MTKINTLNAFSQEIESVFSRAKHDVHGGISEDYVVFWIASTLTKTMSCCTFASGPSKKKCY